MGVPQFNGRERCGTTRIVSPGYILQEDFMSAAARKGDVHDAMIGVVLGGCRIRKRVGRGGMGTVYMAVRESDRRRVAVKILAPFFSADPTVVARFDREARAAARVDHPNVVRIWTASHENGLYFTVMDYVDGENLSDLIRRKD